MARDTVSRPSRLRHAARLGRDVVGYSFANRAWWIVPVALVLAAAALILAAGHAAVPYTIYTLI